MIQTDDGFFFGIGLFETISVINGKPQLFDAHFERMKKSADVLGLSLAYKDFYKVALKKIDTLGSNSAQQKWALKITLTEKNLFATIRQNHYTEEQYRQGFRLCYSQVLRNETSLFTYHKTLNYGDCILEKRKAMKNGFDEPVFLNSGGEITEGATSNLFFVRNGDIFTPKLECGLLKGIMRDFIMKKYPVKEVVIKPKDVEHFEAMFITNSLLGVMPVQSLGDHCFETLRTF